ncbi:hypothetical protein PQX77_014175 [Marasmius sp. AFHP31]|nr:hypothetical protein PQX77_014175 [Marasmius sp. AFHP31]
MVNTPSVGSIAASLNQAAVPEQVQQATLRPDLSEAVSASSPGHQLHGIYNPNPSLPSDLISAPAMYTGDTVSPSAFFGSEEDAHRAPYPPTPVTIDNATAPAPSRWPLSVHMGSRQVPCAVDIAVDFALRNPTGSGATFPQTQSFDRGIPANYSHNTPGSPSYCVADSFTPPSFQNSLPRVPNDLNNAYEPGVSPTGQAGANRDLINMGSHTHVHVAPSSKDASGRRLVGSPAITQASTVRRRGEALYFCDVLGCTSEGFTARHNLRWFYSQTMLACTQERGPSGATVVGAPSIRIVISRGINAQIESDPARVPTDRSSPQFSDLFRSPTPCDIRTR